MDTVTLKINLEDKVSGPVHDITAKVDGLTEAVQTGCQAARDASGVFGKLTDSLIKYKTIGESIASLGDLFSSISQPAIAFEAGLADLSSITGVVGKDLEMVADMARRIGRESGLGAETATRAFTLLASNIQVPIEQYEELLNKSATLSAATGMTIDEAAASLASTVNQFGLATSESERVINVLAAGSKYGAATVQELSASFKVVGATANALGLDVEKTAGALEVLSKASIKGSEAGTALRNIMLAMSTKLGVDFNVTSLSDALAALKPRMTDTEFLVKTFGSESIAAAQFLIGTADAVDEMTSKVTDTQIAFEQAAIREDTWAHRLELAKAAVDEAKISIGNFLGPIGAYGSVISQNVNELTTLITGWTSLKNIMGQGVRGIISRCQWFRQTALAQNIASAATKTWNFVTTVASNVSSAVTLRLGAMRAAIMRTTVAQKAAAVATKAWSAIQTVFNVIMNMNPIGLIVLGIGLLIAAIVAVRAAIRKWGDEFLFVLGPLGSAILAFKTHWDSIKRAFTEGGFVEGLKRIGQVLMDVLLRPVQKLLGWVGELTGWEWAKNAANWVQEVRVKNNLAEPDGAQASPSDTTTEQGATPLPSSAMPSAPADESPMGIGSAASSSVATATAQSGQIKRIDITIDKVVENFTVSTTNLQNAASDIRDMVARALVDAVNDVNYAL